MSTTPRLGCGRRQARDGNTKAPRVSPWQESEHCAVPALARAAAAISARAGLQMVGATARAHDQGPAAVPPTNPARMAGTTPWDTSTSTKRASQHSTCSSFVNTCWCRLLLVLSPCATHPAGLLAFSNGVLCWPWRCRCHRIGRNCRPSRCTGIARGNHEIS